MSRAVEHLVLSGASGFLGGYFLAEAHHCGLSVTTVGRRAVAGGDHVSCDLATATPLFASLPTATLVVHNAGLAHRVPKTEAEKAAFFAVNQAGTERFLAALTPHADVLTGVVFISTVAVYGLQQGENIDEGAATLAQDPYGVAKMAAERVVTAWGRDHRVPVWCLRLPLIAGADPPGNLGAMIRAIRAGYYCRIGNGGGRRSWVWAEDVARLALQLKGNGGVYNLTDGVHPSFLQIEQQLRRICAKPRGLVLPRWMAGLLAGSGDVLDRLPGVRAPFNSARLQKMEAHLIFDDAKARRELDWSPRPVLDHAHEVFHVG